MADAEQKPTSITQPIQPTRLKLRQLFTLKPSQWLLAWAIGLITLIATVGLLSVSGWFISAAAIAGLVLGSNAISFDFFRPAAMIRALAITRTAGRYGERLASHHAVLALLTDLRVLFFAAIGKQKLSDVQRLVQSADVMQRLTHDIDQLDELPLRFWLPWLWALVLQGLLLGFVAYFSAPLAKVMALPLLLAGVFVPAVGVWLGRSIALKHTELAERRRRDLLNPLTASTSLILWQRWQTFQDAFGQTDNDYGQLHLRQHLIGLMLNTVQQLLLAGVVVLLIWQGYAQIVSGALSVPMLLAFVLAVLGMYEILLPLASGYTAYGFAAASRNRLNTLTDESIELASQAAARSVVVPFPKTSQLHLKAEHIYAKFSTALNGVSNVNFGLSSGEVLFIKGRSGAGKSTLLSVLAGELPLTAGVLMLNESPLACTDTAEHIGFLAQQLDIFDLTLAENLRVGHVRASDDELWHVLEMVKLADWAKSQPDGLRTQLGEYGAGVSGGQARRIALARLLLKPRSILLLDEPFAGLDAESAAHVYAALKAHQAKGLLVIVSHHFVPDGARILSI